MRRTCPRLGCGTRWYCREVCTLAAQHKAPALQISASILPASRSTLLTAAATDLSSVTSSCTASIWGAEQWWVGVWRG